MCVCLCVYTCAKTDQIHIESMTYCLCRALYLKKNYLLIDSK